MKILVAGLLTLASTFPANAQSNGAPPDTYAAIHKLEAALQDSLMELSVLDDSDKKIATSNRTQVDTTKMLESTERSIKTEELPALQERARAADETRQRILDSGCPVGGGEVPAAVADRCNPLIRAHKAEVQDIFADMETVKTKLATVESTRRAVTETTLANANQKRINNNRRDELQAKRLRLLAGIISQSLALTKNKSPAADGCKALRHEKAACCLSVVWDGASPDRCDVELIYQVFETAGVFGTREVKPIKHSWSRNQ